MITIARAVVKHEERRNLGQQTTKIERFFEPGSKNSNTSSLPTNRPNVLAATLFAHYPPLS